MEERVGTIILDPSVLKAEKLAESHKWRFLLTAVFAAAWYGLDSGYFGVIAIVAATVDIAFLAYVSYLTDTAREKMKQDLRGFRLSDVEFIGEFDFVATYKLRGVRGSLIQEKPLRFKVMVRPYLV